MKFTQQESVNLWFQIARGHADQLLSWWGIPADVTLCIPKDCRIAAGFLRNLADGIERAGKESQRLMEIDTIGRKSHKSKRGRPHGSKNKKK